MSVANAMEIIAFGASALIAVAGALGMATTMSMFRSAIFLMASFMGVAGLFILLSADLLGLLQIMMYVGGMLVMVLFMVLFMPDPGGAMMASMPRMMTPIERLFSLGLAQKTAHTSAGHGGTGRTEQGGHHGGEPKEQSKDRHGDHEEHQAGGDDYSAHGEQHGHHGNQGMDQMDMSDMSMVTPVRKWGALLAVASASVLVLLLVLRPSWPASRAVPDPNSAQQVGSLLMSQYMVGFEGAGLLILIGIVGAVLAAHSGRYADARDRQARVAVKAPPPDIAAEDLAPEIESFSKCDSCTASFNPPNEQPPPEGGSST